MQFLIDANMPLSAAPLIRHCGYTAVDVRDVKMGMAEDQEGDCQVCT